MVVFAARDACVYSAFTDMCFRDWGIDIDLCFAY